MNCVQHILALPAEDDVDPVAQRSVLLWDGKPRLPAHDHHILLACRTARCRFIGNELLLFDVQAVLNIQNSSTQGCRIPPILPVSTHPVQCVCHTVIAALLWPNLLLKAHKNTQKRRLGRGYR